MDERDTTDDGPAEVMLRDTMRRHEQLAAGAGPRLLSAVRERSRTRGRAPRWVAAAAAATLAVGAVPVGIALLDGGGTTPAGPVVTYSPWQAGEIPDGWRWESSLGILVAVPATWTVNDFGCNQSDASSVVRGFGPQEGCATPEPPTKEVVSFLRLPPDQPPPLEEALLDPATPAQDTVVDSVAVRLFSGEVVGGRSGALVVVPDQGVALLVRTRSEQTTATILGSLRLAFPTDNVGCPVRRPAVEPPSSSGGPLVDLPPVAVSLCYYGPSDEPAERPELLSSGELTGDAAVQLVTLLNAAAAGRNPDTPENQCSLRDPAPADAVLLVRGGSGSLERVWVTWSDCVHRGLDNGADQAQVTQAIIAAIMAPLGVGYVFTGDLPA